MKKLLIFIFLFFLVFQNKAFAQSVFNSSIIDTTKFVGRTSILLNPLNAGAPSIAGTVTNNSGIALPPFTTVTFDKGSFSTNAQVVAYQGKWDNIKTLIPKGYSPISSFVLVMLGPSGTVTTPIKSPTVTSRIPVGSGDNIYFYPITADGKVDQGGITSNKGLNITAQLPTKDVGFIIASDKTIDKNSPLLTAATPHPILNQASKKPALPQNFTYIILVVLLLIGLGIFTKIALKKVK